MIEIVLKVEENIVQIFKYIKLIVHMFKVFLI